MTNKKLGKWIKGNVINIALVAMLFAASMIEQGAARGAWIAGAVCYSAAVMCLFSLAIPNLFFRTRPSWTEWSLLLLAASFAALAYLFGVPELAKMGGLVGLAAGAVLGLYFTYLAWRVRAKRPG